MIKSIPGWLNFFILWAAYFIAGAGLNLLLNWIRQEMRIKFNVREARKASLGPVHVSPERKAWFMLIDWAYVLLITAVYCGAYLAKWRFYDDGWHFF